jgi:hypothetical protein
VASVRRSWDYRPVTLGEHADPLLTLVYVPRTPSHYVARLGDSGWLEGWGWSVEEALASLADRVYELAPTALPSGVGANPTAILEWLRVEVPMPVLDE